MSIDWDRRHCARKGHITYAPDEQRLREKLHAPTAVGTVWRCLRCGDFVLGEPHGSGPADRAPRVLRGRALRDLFILRFLAVERVLRGLLVIAAAWAVWKFSNSQDAVRRLFEEDLTVFRPVADHFGYDLDHSPVVGTIQKTFDYKKSHLQEVAAAMAGYALIEVVEGVGLWFAKRWAEYLAVVATAAFLPIEVYELTEKMSWFKIGTLALNVLAVLYILIGKRLFGIRGGHAAFEAQRRSASLLEVEEAAGERPAPLPVRPRDASEHRPGAYDLGSGAPSRPTTPDAG
ncbi:DUF2127 domain-containing protein [Actinacidiphila sp. DG2A-62]|jgi:uncharacterized membrane protein (DUF2068 family)|uniref:DUF2127 domain-containing protein n=1 Tax=Actinacidiphila sp. DG2A-62 TaxID=3108821 RepID=UPI002DB9FE11|nr:DUF2127 domain-containing protein [Actinacidiphila sp. DG2A-62]MEC3997283.1 DUF2127 domain-containing protein [Actinacidiphila sp. DG2A-62]